MSDRIIPFVRNAMVNDSDPRLSFDESFMPTLDHLAEGGSQTDQLCAKEALEWMKTKESGRVGKERHASVSFPYVMK